MSRQVYKIFAWNCNGLRAVIKKGALQSLLAAHDPDFLCLGETKISDPQVDSEHIREAFPDYHQFYSCADRKGYSGTAIWAKKNFIKFSDATTAEHPCQTPSPDPLKEGRITLLELPDFYLVSVYVPNSKDDLSRLKVRQDWDKDLQGYLASLQKTKPIIVCGDMNVAHNPIDLARPRENEGKHGYTTEERTGFTSLLEKLNLSDTFRHLHPDTVAYTWWSHWGHARERNVGWRIDYILASKSLMSRITSAKIYPEILGSDHCPISIDIDIISK